MDDKKDFNVSCLFFIGLILFFVFLPLAVILIVVIKLGQSSSLDKEYEKAKSKVKKTSKEVEKKVEEKAESVIKDLSERQQKIFSEIIAKGEVEMSHLDSKFKNVTARTLRRDLAKLVSLGHVVKSGSTRNSTYKAKK